MTKYNVHDYNNQENLYWALMSVVSQLTNDEFKEKVEPPFVEAELTVYGKEIDFIKFMDKYFRQIDRIVEERALEMVEEKFASVNNLVCDIEDYAKEKLWELKQQSNN